jgi:tRNA modification GTPase
MAEERKDEGTTIVAVATAAGSAALSLLRLSGPAALRIADLATDGKASAQQHRMLRRVAVRDAEGRVIDDGMLAVFRAPASFTGEDCVEFTGHGGSFVTGEVLARFLECGAVAAAPGEFTSRAFVNGKLDLTQAEAVIDLIGARSRMSLRAARGLLEGGLGRRAELARNSLLEALAHLEAWIDFPEEDIDPVSGEALRERVRSVLCETESLLATYDQGRFLREGARTVICGRPNVGKSSVLNRVLGRERAIVSSEAGTTRDTIEESVAFGGVPLRIIDTAGMREGAGEVEAEGIRRTLRQLESADLVLEIFDGSVPVEESALVMPDGVARIRVLNKADLAEHASWNGVETVRVSCVDGSGFGLLAERVRDSLHFGEGDWGGQSVAINARHRAALLGVRDSLQGALASMESAGGAEFAAADLREALDGFGEIAGRVGTEDLLGVVFSSFCIGK